MSTDTTTSKGDPRESLNVASRVILKSSSNRACFEFMRAVWKRIVQGSILFTLATRLIILFNVARHLQRTAMMKSSSKAYRIKNCPVDPIQAQLNEV